MCPWRRVFLFLVFVFGVIGLSWVFASPSISLNGWVIYQFNPDASYALTDVEINPGDYVIIARNSTQALFESFWGVDLDTFPHQVIYINSGNQFPDLVGGEYFLLKDESGGIADDSTVSLYDDGVMQREAPGLPPGDEDSWLFGFQEDATPGYGACLLYTSPSPRD